MLLCFIDPRERKIRNEASSCPGIFSKTLPFYYVASSPGSPLPHLLDGHRKLVGRSVITVFGKHCKCIAQKCTHLGRLPPLVSHLLLLRHCVLTWYRGKKKKSPRKRCITGIRTRVHQATHPRSYNLRYESRFRWAILFLQ